MFIIVSLNKKNIYEFKKLNDKRRIFNELNEDFFSIYEQCNFIDKYALRRQVKLLKDNNNFLGFIWFVKEDNNTFFIRSIVVNEECDAKNCYRALLGALNCTGDVIYTCQSNNHNTELLGALGFKVIEGTIEMCLKAEDLSSLDVLDDICFERMKRGEQEGLRCKIQNEIFENDDRIPLTIEDIYFDEEQSYYLEEGAIFIKAGSCYVGYGQIVVDRGNAYIVNFGILKEYRGKGYGKYLIQYLVKLIKSFGFNKVYIKVDSDNNKALKLYEAMGFEICNKYFKFMIIKNK